MKAHNRNTVDVASIPQELKDYPQWVCWKHDKQKGKVPYDPKSGMKAAVDNPDTWADFQKAEKVYLNGASYDGMGFVFSGNGIAGADFDHCIDDSGELAEWAADEVFSFDSYCELSPSGDGIHIIFKSNHTHKGVKTVPVEIYSQGRFFTFTGNIYDPALNTLEDCTEQHRRLWEEHRKEERTESKTAGSDHTEWNQADKDLHATISKSKQGEKFHNLFSGNWQGYPSKSEADMALCSILAFWANKDSKQIDRIFRKSGLYRPKWDEKRGDLTYGQKTIGNAIAGTKETVGGSKPQEDSQDDISIKEWPHLDPRALHGFAGRFVEFATRNSEADPAAVLATLIVRFGAEIDEPAMWIGDSRHRANLAGVIVGSSSKSRKGTSSKPVIRLHEPLEFETSEKYTKRARFSRGPFSSGEGIIYAVRDSVQGIDKKTGQPVEVDPGVTDKRLFVLDEEFGGVMKNTQREGNTLSMIIRTVWDGGTLEPLTKNSRIKATHPHIGWVSHITLHELVSRLSETEMFNGYANRVLWICARRSKLVPWPEPMNEKDLALFQGELSTIIEAVNIDTMVKPDEEVRAIWNSYYYELLTEDRSGLVGCILNRAEAQVVRLSMLYALLDSSHTIRIEHLEAAMAMWRYCEDSAQYIFAGRQTDNVAQRILEALKDGKMTGTDLHRLFSNNISKDRLAAALSELEAAGKIGMIKTTPEKGRPTTYYFLKGQTKQKN